MAWWGIAYANGPHYNRAWIRYTEAEIDRTLPDCHDAVTTAVSLSGDGTPAELALIQALAKRYRNGDERDSEVLDGWHWDYAAAMRDTYRAHEDDADIAALYFDAALNCTPRQLWNLQTGQPNARAHTSEVMPVMDAWMERIERSGLIHPGIVHLYIHALEMSPMPERGLNAADLLRGLLPDAGHLEHMSAHIYVLCGDWAQSVVQSERAVSADDKYLAYAGDQNFYTTMRCHDLHLYMYAAMFLGQFGKATHAADRIRAMATPELIARSAPFMASILDGYSAMCTHVLVRFGRWQDLIASSLPQERSLRPIETAMHAYGQGVAHAALGHIEEAEAARDAFDEAAAAIPEDAIFLSNTVRDMLRIGAAMLDGELEYGRRTTIAHSPACALPSRVTTGSTTPNPGPGCILRAMRSARSSPSRACSAKPKPCFAPTWATTLASRAAASIPITCGRSRGWLNASNTRAMPTSFVFCDRGWSSRKPAPTFQSKLPASVDRLVGRRWQTLERGQSWATRPTLLHRRHNRLLDASGCAVRYRIRGTRDPDRPSPSIIMDQ